MNEETLKKLAEDAELQYSKANAFTLICYKSNILNTYTCPNCIPGIGEEALTSFIVNSKRAAKLGQVPKQNIGLECYVLGEFNDSTGKIELYDEPVYLFTLEAPDEASPITIPGGIKRGN